MNPSLILKSLAVSANPAREYDAKEIFHQDGKTFLHSVAKALGMQTKDYDLRSNKGGIAVSGEITLHSDNLYLQLSHSCMGRGAQVLFRTCDGRTDYCGHVNHLIQMTLLKDLLEQQIWLKKLTLMANPFVVRAKKSNTNILHNTPCGNPQPLGAVHSYSQTRVVNRASTGLDVPAGDLNHE